MDFSAEQIKKVAKLAKIRLTDDEINLFSGQFVAITNIISKLQGVNTDNVTPINNPSNAETLLREDVVNDGNYVNDIMSNSPKQTLNCFVVPKVIE